MSEQPSNSIENIEENKIDGPVVRMRKKGTVEMHPPNILVQPSSPLLQVRHSLPAHAVTCIKRSPFDRKFHMN